MRLFMYSLLIVCLIILFPYYVYVLSLMYHRGKFSITKEVLRKINDMIKN